MPGPSNMKKKRKSQGKSQKKKPVKHNPLLNTAHDSQRCLSPCSSRSDSQQLVTPPPVHVITSTKEATLSVVSNNKAEEHVPHLTPFIYDPGTGPRVRDTRAFLTSRYFSQPPALEIPLCAEFAQEEVLQMLCTVLPEETALILWYNKSRSTSRICPTCQRLYRLGDTLPDHLDDEPERVHKRPSPQLEREQELSGLCSPVCFILASFNYPGAIKSAWGRMEDEIDDVTWELLNGPGEGNAQGDLGLGLGMLMKMTRLPDLGLGQLCLGDDHGSIDESYDYGEWSPEPLSAVQYQGQQDIPVH